MFFLSFIFDEVFHFQEFLEYVLDIRIFHRFLPLKAMECVHVSMDSITLHSQIPDAVVTGMPDSLGEQLVYAEVGEDLFLLSLSSRQPAQTRGVGILLRFRVKQYYFNVYFVKVKEKMRFK